MGGAESHPRNERAEIVAKAETNIVNDIQLALSQRGCRLFKNVRGMFLSLDGKRKIRAGMQPEGSSDLIGWVKVRITPEMVNSEIAVFCAIEVKTATGATKPEQLHFINTVLQSRGFAGVARDAEQALKIIEKTV